MTSSKYRYPKILLGSGLIALLMGALGFLWEPTLQMGWFFGFGGLACLMYSHTRMVSFLGVIVHSFGMVVLLIFKPEDVTPLQQVTLGILLLTISLVSYLIISLIIRKR